MYFAIGVAALAAVSSYSAAQSAAKQSDAQAALYERAGTRQREINAIRETQQRAASSKLMGQQRARMAASGIEPSTGSALMTQVETARDAEFQALLTRSAGAFDAQTTEIQASLQRWQSRDIRSGALLNAALAGGRTYLAAGGGRGKPDTSSVGQSTASAAWQTPTIGYDYYGS